MSRLSLVEVRSLTKTIEKKIVLNEVNFNLYPGELSSLVGINGSGKTIFFRCLLGYESLDSGKIIIDGHELSERNHIRKVSFFVPSDSLQYCELLTPNELFTFIIHMHRLNKIESQQLINKLCKEFFLDGYLDQLIKHLSFGTKKKVILLSGLLYDPLLLICDEIFEGLDEKSVEAVIRIFKERVKNNRSVLYSSHHHAIIKEISSNMYTIHNQKIEAV